MVNEQHEYLQGKFLLSLPSLDGSYFEKTLIYICTHSKQGALGVVVNRPIEMTAQELLKRINAEGAYDDASSVNLVEGGPVLPYVPLVLHSSDWGTSDTLKFSEEIYLTFFTHLGADEVASYDALGVIAAGAGPEHYLIALGHAGWGPGQLDNEMQENSWISSPYDEALIFGAPFEDRYDYAMQSIGVDLGLMAARGGEA